MTSPVSSSKPTKAARYSPWAHSFRQAARDGLAVSALSCIAYLAAIAGTVVYAITQRSEINNQPIYTLFRYYLFNGMYLNLILPIMILVITLVQGMMTFRLLFNKSSANAWYSLGISRSGLFWSRFLAGAMEIILPVFIAMAASLLLNLSVFPDTGLVFAQWLKMLAGLLAQALAIYSIAAAACALSATLVESVCYSFILVCMPTVLLMSLNALMVRFLFGNSIGAPEYYWSTFNPELLTTLSGVNPLLFMRGYIARYAMESSYTAQQDPVSALPVIGWFIAAAVIACLAFWFFKRRKVENTGVMGAGKALPYLCVFTVSFLAFALPHMLATFSARNRMPGVLSLPLSCGAAAIVFFAMAIPLKLIAKPVWKSLPVLAAGLAVMLAAVGALSSGGFGYSSYVPDPKNVSGVTVTYNGIPSYVPNDESTQKGGWIQYRQTHASLELAEPADIAAMTGLHEEIIKTGRTNTQTNGDYPEDMTIGSNLRIRYKMKDGSTVERCYSAPTTRLLAKTLTLDMTQGAKNILREYMTGDYWESGFQYGEEYTQGAIYVSTRFNASTAPIQLSEDKRTQLLECLVEDLEAQSMEERYYPSNPEICVLRFSRQDYGLQENSLPNVSEDVYITDSFGKTLAFLNENGFSQMLAGQGAEVESLEVLRYGKLVGQMNDMDLYSPLFIGGLTSAGEIKKSEERFAASLYAITDQGRINDVLAYSHLQYFTLEDGYLVLIKYKGEDRLASAFLPMRDAPEYVKEGAK